MARVLFDAHFSQGWQHRRDLGHDVPPYLGLPRNSGPRLQSVCEILQVLGLEPVFSEDELPSPSDMDEFEIIVTGSRLKAFADEEIAGLVRFAEGCGGLLIMSNHGAPEGASNDFTRYDRPLVDRFGIELECTVFKDPDGSRIVPATGKHPTTAGVGELAINNCSSLVCERMASVVDIPATWNDLLGGKSSRGRAAAFAIDEGMDGRVFVLSDSGFIGSEGTRSPGPGLIEQADNRRFLSNIFSWLAKRSTQQ